MHRCYCLLDFANFLESELKVIHRGSNGDRGEYEACLPELKTPVKYSWADEIEAAEVDRRTSRANTVSDKWTSLY